MRNGFNKVQKNISAEETANMKHLIGEPTKQFFKFFDFIKTYS